jgi:hypothetical protein
LFSQETRDALRDASVHLSDVVWGISRGGALFEEGTSSGLTQFREEARATPDARKKHPRVYGFEERTVISEAGVTLDIKLLRHPHWRHVQVDLAADGKGEAIATRKNGLLEHFSFTHTSTTRLSR